MRLALVRFGTNSWLKNAVKCLIFANPDSSLRPSPVVNTNSLKAEDVPSGYTTINEASRTTCGEEMWVRGIARRTRMDRIKKIS